jgi:hypothetical protein
MWLEIIENPLLDQYHFLLEEGLHGMLLSNIALRYSLSISWFPPRHSQEVASTSHLTLQ